jgi:competence protein ComEC
MFFSILRIFPLFAWICSLFLVACQDLTNYAKSKLTFQVHFIDVGQGDACLLQTPSHRFYLYDTGNNDAALLGFLEKKGVDSLSAVFISHPDLDHYGAFLSILRDIPVKKAYLPVESSSSQAWTHLVQALDSLGIEKVTLLAGDTLIWDHDISVRTLWPYSKADYEGNNLSTVLRIEYASHSLLLTGDIENESEMGILESREKLKSDILKVAHHGSQSSSGLPFLGAVKPTFAIISCDSAVYGHPHIEAIADLKLILGDSNRILRTDRMGSIGFTLDEQGVHRL